MYTVWLFHTVMHICVEKSPNHVERTAVATWAKIFHAEILNRGAMLGYNNVLSHASRKSKPR